MPGPKATSSNTFVYGVQSSELLGKTIAQALSSKVREGFSGILSSGKVTLTCIKFLTSQIYHAIGQAEQSPVAFFATQLSDGPFKLILASQHLANVTSAGQQVDDGTEPCRCDMWHPVDMNCK